MVSLAAYNRASVSIDPDLRSVLLVLYSQDPSEPLSGPPLTDGVPLPTLIMNERTLAKGILCLQQALRDLRMIPVHTGEEEETI